MVSLVIKQNRSGPVKGFHPWVFSNAIKEIPEGLVPGEPVHLIGEDGRFIGAGYFNSYSQIAVRLWGYDEKETVDEAFFMRRIKKAYEIRGRYIANPGTDSFRVVHGENDFLPGLIVDKYADYLVVQFHTRGIDVWRNHIVAALDRELTPKGIYERSDVAVRKIESLQPKEGVLLGSVPDLISIKENGFTFLVDVKKGQKTGFFLDQRDKRQAFMKYSCDAEVLNCFSYTGGFSVYALAGGAKRVVNVDTSETALAIAKENIRINGFALARCEFVNEDAKKYLRDIEGVYGAIILDPPAFIKDRRKKPEGIAGYRSINEMAIRALAPGGVILTCSCSAHLSLQELQYIISEAGGKARRPLRIIETFTHGIDHPELVPYMEGIYLKCLLMMA